MTVLRPDIGMPEPIQDDVRDDVRDDIRDHGYAGSHDRTGWRDHAMPLGAHPMSHDGAHITAQPAMPTTVHTTPTPNHHGTTGQPPVNRHELLADALPVQPDLNYQPSAADLANSSKLIRLHESIGSLLASRGEWQQAYQHLRSALDLVYSDRIDQPPVPEQLRREVDRLRKEHAEAREQSIRDSLTASYNRRYLDQRLTSLLAETCRAAEGLAVALVDLDWFKQVNDTFGHLLGDRVLQRVVDLLSDGLSDGAFCARYGGEEFVLVVPDIDAATALAVAESARERVERYQWSQLVPGLRVTVSIGLAYQPHGAGRAPTSAEQQLLRADGLLYAAKQSGRNAVAYRHAGRVLLANGRRIAEPRVAVTPQH